MSFVSYYRVSTARQGASGLGLDAQRAAVIAYTHGSEIVAEFTEVESGKRADRPQLAAAIAYAKKHKAILVIAKLDRLARDVHVISGLMKSGVEFVATDLPMANKLTIHIMAAMAEHEAEMISERTKKALAAAKTRGTKLGGVRHDLANARSVQTEQAQMRRANVLPIVEQIRGAGVTTLNGIAGALNARGIKTPRGGEWSATQVSRVVGARCKESSLPNTG
ncbi:recombinase family protein [Methylorubrum sp. POS3]|uniref:recombinase family protein n=1 Tax=Methylorubrum sp. POS3 TaxID=2998492 RepID=UPI00372CB184